MGYYHRRYGRRNWGSSKTSERQRLTSMFAGIDKDIQKYFFELDVSSLNMLFRKYGEEYGNSAENYARKTYSNWKSGRTTLSGQTAERLLNLIPPYLPKSVKYELIKKLRQHYFKKQRKYIKTTHNQWRNDVVPAVNEIVNRSSEFALPDILSQKATWLTNGDVDAANQVMASLELEEAKVRTNYLSLEFRRIQSLVDHVQNTQTIYHSIELPQGTINVVIEQEKKTFIQSLIGGGRVKETGNDLVTTDEVQKALAEQQKRGSLLNITLDGLSEDQKKQLTEKVLHERMRLDVSQAEADQRFENSTRDMANTIRAVNSLEQSSKSDYEVKSSYETASGKTDIHIKKNNNTVIIIIAVVIGIIILAMMK